MQRLTYTGSFWPLALMAELQAAGVLVSTVYGIVHRQPGQIIPTHSVTIIVPKQQLRQAVADVVAAHAVTPALQAETVQRARIVKNRQAVAAKLRVFYRNMVGLSDQEITDSNLAKE